MLIAARVILVEYLQNLPVLLGLMLAISARDWLSRLLWLALGALGTAVLIAQTERVKLNKTEPEHPGDLVINAFSFLGGGLFYLAYYVFVRSNAGSPLVTDVVVGLLMGAGVGVMQMFFVDERKLTLGAVTHAGSLALSGVLAAVLIGTASDSWSPLPAAAGLCLLVTLVIVRIDYWPLITAKQGSKGPEAT